MPPDIAQSDSVKAAALVQKGKSRMLVHMVLYVVGGAAVGFGYHKIVGCRSGACPITANPYISTLYGALVGFFAGGGRL